MLLIHLLKILFFVLVTRHIIKWVSYHLHSHNKKARVFHGNCRMPFDVEFAFMYGINALTKTRFKVKDLSYRKNLVEWWCILNSLYPPDSESNATPPPHANLNPNPIPLLFLGGDKAHARSRGGPCTLNKTSNSNSSLVIGNRERKPFPQLKTGNNTFNRIKKIHNVFSAKPSAKNNNVISSFLINAKIINFKNLKIPQNPIPFPKQTFACTRQIFMVCFHFYFL